WYKGETTTIKMMIVETTAEIMARDPLLINNLMVKPKFPRINQPINNVGFADLESFANLEDTNPIMSSTQEDEHSIAILDPNFTAVTFEESRFVPPDSMGAVGPTQYIALVNGRIKSFNKSTGLPDGVLNATTN